MNRRALPAALTSYDFLKFTALALMVVDHIGAFFLPEEAWVRVAGRLSAPIWLFLIGYARTREISPTMIGGTLVLLASSFVAGQPLLPFSILATMLVCRIAIDPLMETIAKAPVTLYPVTVLLFMATLPSFMVFEYGTVAMLFVMIGYMARNAETLPFTRQQLLQFTGVASGLFGLTQLLLFSNFDFAQGLTTGFGVLLLGLALTCFRPVLFESITGRIPVFLSGLVKIGGRYSLEFYIAHFLIFRAVAIALDPEKPDFFSFHILL